MVFRIPGTPPLCWAGARHQRPAGKPLSFCLLTAGAGAADHRRSPALVSGGISQPRPRDPSADSIFVRIHPPLPNVGTGTYWRRAHHMPSAPSASLAAGHRTYVSLRDGLSFLMYFISVPGRARWAASPIATGSIAFRVFRERFLGARTHHWAC